MIQKFRHFFGNLYHRIAAWLRIKVKLTAVEGEVSGVKEDGK